MYSLLAAAPRKVPSAAGRVKLTGGHAASTNLSKSTIIAAKQSEAGTSR
jgi:hypothetical protein